MELDSKSKALLKKILKCSEYKFCRRGKHMVLKSNFAKERRTKDGLRANCKDCINECQRETYYKHKERWVMNYTPKNTEWKKRNNKYLPRNSKRKVFKKTP